MYVALRTLRVMQGKSEVEVPPGSPVDVSLWSERVINAHLHQRLIKEVATGSEETAATPVTKKKKSEGAKVASL